MKTYWNHEGKYQEWVNKIEETTPSMYDTDNKYMNIFLAFSNIYYDIYNNGGGNIEDCYMDKVSIIEDFLGRGNFDCDRAIFDKEYLEEKANEIFGKLMEQDLSFENHGFWNEWRNRKISMTEQVGEDWIYITCGTEENVKKEFEERQRCGFEVV